MIAFSDKISKTPKEIFSQVLKIDLEKYSFKLIRKDSTSDGYRHESYQQFFGHIPIEDAIYLLHYKDQQLYLANGSYCNLPTIDTQIDITTETALTNIKTKLGTKHYAWEDANMEKFIKDTNKDVSASFAPKPTLWIVKNLQQPLSYQLVYKFDIHADGLSFHEYVYVSASTGEVIKNMAADCHADGASLYSGTVQINTSLENGVYVLKDYTRGQGIETYNLRGGSNSITDIGNALNITDNDNNWTASELTTNQAGIDAHWGAALSYDYWNLQHNRNSYDGNGTKIKNYVNYGTGFNQADAFWSSTLKSMFYGNGFINLSKPLVSLDVLSHEIGHGVTSTFGLTASAGGGEAASINESFSDIWAACITLRNSIDNPANSINSDPWLLGEQIMITSTCVPQPCTAPPAQRSMKNPTIYGHPKFYNGQYWANNAASIHARAGVMNYWFYLLIKGGVGETGIFVNPISNDTLSAIAKMERVLYRTYNYIGGTANNSANSITYALMREYSLEGAKEAGYSTCSPEYHAITSAWAAVGVGSPTYMPTLQFSQTSAFICDNSTGSFTAQFSAANSATSYRWELPNNPTGITFLDGSYTGESTSATINVKVDFSVLGQNYISINYIPLTVSVACPTNPAVRISQTYLFWAGMPMSPRIQSHTPQACYNELYTITADIGYGISDYIWQSATPNTLRFVSQSYNQAILKSLVLAESPLTWVQAIFVALRPI